MALSFIIDFWNTNGRNLNKPDLACLRQDPSIYRTLLLQIKGKIDYDNTGIWFEDGDLAKNKFLDFFSIAVEQDADLAVTPEYSCPWEVIDQMLKSQRFPAKEKLWIIGCSSINPVELNSLIKGNPNVTWIYDENLVNRKIASDPNKFFDPLCYFLNTTDLNGNEKKVVIVQFKNTPFGGAELEWERDNFIKGDTFYVISNQMQSTHLITFICSDSLAQIDFNTINNGIFTNLPLLLVHIQLNQKPFQDNYKSYRNTLFDQGDANLNKEILCLNWARNVTYQDGETEKEFNKYGGSALYLKSEKIDKSDERINNNHRFGLYYTYWESKRAHVYYLNFDEYIFCFENTKPSQENAIAAQRRRSGPAIIKVYQWADNNWHGKEDDVDDNFNRILLEVETDDKKLDCLRANISPVDKERLIQLSSGGTRFRNSDWFGVSNLDSFRIESSEINNRLLFIQDPDANSLSKKAKKIVRYSILKHGILTDNNSLPDFLHGAELKYNEGNASTDKYLLNLHVPESNLSATGIYIGEDLKTEAVVTYEIVSKLFKDSQQGKLVMVWYTSMEGRIRIPEVIPSPSITENTSMPVASFRKKSTND